MGRFWGGARPGSGRKKSSSNKVEAKRVRAERKALLRAQIDAEECQPMVRAYGWGDIRELYDEHGNFKPISSLTYEQQLLIAGFDIVKRNITAGDGKVDTILKVKLIDRGRFVELAADRVWPKTTKVDAT